MNQYWKIFYWTNFASGFFLIPFIMYFFQSAAYTLRGKAKDAFLTLTYWTLIPAAFGVVLWLVMLVSGKIKLNKTGETVIALTNA